MAKTTPTRPGKLKSQGEKRNSRATVGGPSQSTSSTSTSSPDNLAAKVAGTQALASSFPFNTNKPLEYDPAAAIAPDAGQSEIARDARVTSSTVTEKAASEKVGSGAPTIGSNRTIGPLDRVRVDSTDRPLTTNQGVAVGDNQSSLKARLRGPTLLEDFILREKITHFDPERIPERIVHARGSAAHGVIR